MMFSHLNIRMLFELLLCYFSKEIKACLQLLFLELISIADDGNISLDGGSFSVNRIQAGGVQSGYIYLLLFYLVNQITLSNKNKKKRHFQ